MHTSVAYISNGNDINFYYTLETIQNIMGLFVLHRSDKASMTMIFICGKSREDYEFLFHNSGVETYFSQWLVIIYLSPDTKLLSHYILNVLPKPRSFSRCNYNQGVDFCLPLYINRKSKGYTKLRIREPLFLYQANYKAMDQLILLIRTQQVI